MKILMIGLGSIGQRHLRNLSSYLGDQAEFLAYRVRGLQRTFSDNMQIRQGVSLEEEYSIRRFSDLEDALAYKPDIAYVTNITSQHINCARKAVQAGADVFLEKPISHDMDGVRELLKETEESGRIVFVGFQNRYHPCLQRLKEVVESKELGPIISVQSEIGERLTTMHNYENYAETYMARKDQGGGVIMNQQIHELDYLQWIFGMPKCVTAFSGTNSRLNLSVEDYCDAIFWTDGPHGHFPINAHADFFQFPPRRHCKVICENGWIDADLLGATVTVARNDQVTQEKFHSFQRNQMFVDEMKDFLACVHTREQNTLTLEEGVLSLRMACAIKKASEERRIVDLDEVTI